MISRLRREVHEIALDHAVIGMVGVGIGVGPTVHTIPGCSPSRQPNIPEHPLIQSGVHLSGFGVTAA